MPRDYHAKMTIWSYDKMTDAERHRLIKWLRSQADFLEEEQDNISSRYTARLMICP